MAAATVPTVEPSSFCVGDTVTWKISNTDYPPSGGWTLKYQLVNADAKIAVTSTASGEYHLVELACTTTDDYITGTYSWQSYVENALATERYRIGSGIVDILPNYSAQTSGYDARTWTKITLDAVQARIHGNASTAQLARRVGDLSVQEIPFTDLLKVESDLTARYERELAAENVAQGRRNQPNKVKVRFV